jgi:CheY-like chemotaxis protein
MQPFSSNDVKPERASGMGKGNTVEGTSVLKLLIIGNNPLELSRIEETLTNYPERRMVTAFAFDVRSIVERLLGFRPDHILVDDNIGKSALQEMVRKLSGYRRTKDIPITVLKNSNYTESLGSGVMDYLLKQNFSAEKLYRSLVNARRLRQAQQYLYQAYRKRKGQLVSAFRNPEPAL